MHAIKRHLAAATGLAIVLAALAGSALAAPPSTPPGQENQAAQAAAPEQPATPPGQEKKAEEAAQPAPAATPTPVATGKATAPGQVKKTTTPAPKSTSKSSGINSTTAGTKPSNTTRKNWSTTAGASPDVSKRYGNGTTAAQIATSRGAPGSTEIYSPGNSQPHKVCKKVNKNGKEVWSDVHAVKSYPACVASSSSTSSTKPTTLTTSAGGPFAVVGVTSSLPGAAAASAAGGVAGVEATAPAGGQPAGGVLGAFGVLGAVAGGSLPFTGLPLWAIVLIALATIAVGSALWRVSRPAMRDAV
jgi:hypothetical protein